MDMLWQPFRLLRSTLGLDNVERQGQLLYLFVGASAVFAMALIRSFSATVYKAKLWTRALEHLLFSKDRKFQMPADVSSRFYQLKNQDGQIETRDIYFLRHGESTWNYTFNKGKERSLPYFLLGFLPNLGVSVFVEWLLLVTGQRDSWFYDSPLNDLGIKQSDELHEVMAKRNADNGLGGAGGKDAVYLRNLRILAGAKGAPSSVMVSSNLRRAISTVGIALRSRFANRPDERMKVLTCLQEISRNPDTLSLTPARQQPVPSWIERGRNNFGSLNFADFYANRLDMSQYDGDKGLSSTGGGRLNAFAEWVFEGKNVPRGTAVIAGGHSLWFRTFFRAFLPHSSKHVSKSKKIVNGGCVKLTLVKVPLASGGFGFTVPPESIETVYGGFGG